jgi:hypothetical protein
MIGGISINRLKGGIPGGKPEYARLQKRSGRVYTLKMES